MKPSLKLIALIFLFVNVSIALAQGKKGAHTEGVQDLINATGGKARVSVDKQTGNARFVRLPKENRSASQASDRAATPNAPAQQRAMNFLKTHGNAFGVTNAKSQLSCLVLLFFRDMPLSAMWLITSIFS